MTFNIFKTERLKKQFRAGIGILIGLIYLPIAWLWTRHPKDPLAQAIAEILILGFYGSNSSSPSAQLLARQMRYGQVKGVFFVGQNIGSLKELRNLSHLFNINKKTCLVAIDHEGGIIQRLTDKHGMSTLPTAREIAGSQQNLSQVRKLYYQAGVELKRHGFNVNLGPVLDVDDPLNLAIGRHARSFGTDSKSITKYASAFIEGFTSAGVLCTLKHFPGHGRSIGDSHREPADISTTWSLDELEPFRSLIQTGQAPMIMCGHLRLGSFEPSGKPATFSRNIITNLLRKDLGFDGVVITDDLDMGAITCTHNRKQAIIEAIAAGNDLLMIKNLYAYDPLLPKRALKWIRQAVKKGQLQEQQVLTAAERVRKLKKELFG